MSRSFAPYTQITCAESAVLLFLLLVAFRICLYPAAVFAACAESGFYAALAGVVVDVAVGGVALSVAARGGLRYAPIAKVAKVVIGGLLCALLVFKVAVHTYEAVQFCVNDLFDQALPVMLAVVFVVTAALMANHGFTGVARTALLFVLGGAALFVLGLFFATFSGYGYNLWVLLRPNGVGKGMLHSSLWVGDSAVLLLADMRAETDAGKRARWFAVSAALAVAAIVGFFVNFVYTYGSAGQNVLFAFSRMLTNGDPEELGAVDWPIMLIWLGAVPLHLAMLLSGAAEGLSVALGNRVVRSRWWPITGCAVAAVAAYCALFGTKDGFDNLVQSRWLGWTLWSITAAVGLAALIWVLYTNARRAKQKEKTA